MKKTFAVLIALVNLACLSNAKGQTIMGLVPMWSGDVGNIVIDSVASSWGYVSISYVDKDGTCKIRCLDQFIGRDIWPKPLAIGKGMMISQMLAFKNMLAINISNAQGKETKFAVIDCRTGKTTWKFTYGPNDYNSGNIMAYSPTPYYDYVYIGLGEGRLICRDMQRGDFVFNTDKMSPSFSSNSKLLAANADGVVILSDKISCFDPDTGSLKWTKYGLFYMVDEYYKPRGDQQYFTAMIDGDGKYIAVMKVSTGEVVVKHRVIRIPFRQPSVLYGKLYYPFKDDYGKINLICLDIVENRVLWGHAFDGLDTFSWWSNDGLVGSVIKNIDKTSKVSLLITGNGKESGFFDMGKTDILVFSEGFPYMTVFENRNGDYFVRSYEITRNVWPEGDFELRFRLNAPSAFVNGRYRSLPKPMKKIEGFVSLPVRFVVESLGGNCIYDPKTGKMTCNLNGVLAEFWIGKTTARINNIWTAEDPRAKPFSDDGVMMLPLSFAAYLGIGIELKPFDIWQIVIKPQ